MLKQVEILIERCVAKGYVSEDAAPWLRYALEKRISSIVVFVPLLTIGLMITNPFKLFAFFATFFLLRTRTNGFHAESGGKCLFYSICGEVFFFRVLPAVWNNVTAFISLAMSIALIWILAPYNHPNMDLSSEEIVACAKSAKLRLSILIFSFCALYIRKQKQLSEGILLGVVMTASTLALAYLIPQKRCG